MVKLNGPEENAYELARWESAGTTMTPAASDSTAQQPGGRYLCESREVRKGNSPHSRAKESRSCPSMGLYMGKVSENKRESFRENGL